MTKNIDQQFSDWQRLASLVDEIKYMAKDSSEQKKAIQDLERGCTLYWEKYESSFNPVCPPKWSGNKNETNKNNG